MKTASYAVMFTDIKGFTERTSRQTRAQNERLLRLHDALLVPVIAGYGGRRVKTIGDSYLVVFDSATRALACGAALQDRLALFNRRAEPADRIEVRVAMNAGEVRVEPDDVFGEAVNIAARIEEQAEAGEVCFSEAVYLLADRSWMDVDDLGPHTLRGIPEPVRLYRMRRTPHDGMPYGGATLEQLHLPEPDPAVLGRRRWTAALPWRWLAAAAIAALLVAGALLARHDAGPLQQIEGLLASGRSREAERTLKAAAPEELAASERVYLEGLIAQTRGDYERAIARFGDAATKDTALAEARIAPRLIELLEHERCEVRAAAAKTLGAMRHEAARPALKDLAKREPAETGFFAKLKLGGCNAGDAAREALQTITATR